MVEAIISQAWFTVLFSLLASLVVFPLVVVGSFIYENLVKRYKKTPKILLMLICTFIATLIAVIILEFYLGFTLPQAFSG